MITREQVSDLQPGDVVRLSDEQEGWTVEGALWEDARTLRCGPTLVRYPDGEPSQVPHRVMAVVSRAPRPLYVNHPRTEPVLGDVVRDGNGAIRHALPPKLAAVNDGTYPENEPRWWASITGYDGEWLHCSTDYMRRPLTLLVDGETGQVVQ